MRSSPLARTKLARPVVVSLSGSGFLAAFHMGVMQAFREAEVEIDVIGGASGGALVACGQALGIEPSVMLTRLKRTAALCRKDGVRSVPLHLHAAIQETLPLDLDVTRITQLRIAVTRVWPYERTLVESFTTRDDLVAALETSCHIPFYLGGFARSFRGNPLYIDGGLWCIDLCLDFLSIPRSALCRSWIGCSSAERRRGNHGAVISAVLDGPDAAKTCQSGFDARHCAAPSRQADWQSADSDAECYCATDRASAAAGL